MALKITTTKLGQVGEQLAKTYLIKQGFHILEANYRYKRAEVDLIAQKENLMIFVEVKMRKNDRFGTPETFVTAQKAQLVHTAASHYLEEHQWNGSIRFDIIAILDTEILLLEDAF